MAHPQDRTRRQPPPAAAGCGGRRLGVGALGLLAGCENTTTPIGACEGDGSSNLVVPKPTGPGGLPLPRPDNAVTWAITADNEPIAGRRRRRGRPARDLQLRRLPRPGPGQEVREADRPQGADRDLQLVRRGDREARVGRRRLRRDHRPLRLEHRQPDRAAAAAAAQPLVPRRTSRRTSGRSCRTRSTTAAAATRCRTSSGRTGSAGATTRSTTTSPAMKVPWDIFWESEPYKGKVAVLDDKRDALAMPMQRDAMRTGRRPDLNTEDAEIVAQGRQGPRPADGHRQRQGRDHRLPDAARGQDLAPPGVVGRPARRGVLLHAEGRAAERALVLGPGRERRRPERLLLHRPHGEEPGARAPLHRLHARREERVRQHGQLRRLHAAAERDHGRVADQERADPEEPHRRRRPPRPVRRSTRSCSS